MEKQLLIPTQEPSIQIINNQLMVSSLDVAEKFNKRHDNVIQAIKRLDIPEDFNALNFKAVEYSDVKGEKRKAYNITRDGFVILVMGFTGKEAMQWKIRYIQAFNAMEAALRDKTQLKLDDYPDKQLGLITELALQGARKFSLFISLGDKKTRNTNLITKGFKADIYLFEENAIEPKGVNYCVKYAR